MDSAPDDPLKTLIEVLALRIAVPRLAKLDADLWAIQPPPHPLSRVPETTGDEL